MVANLARHLKVDPEAALRAANAKFIRRFNFIEAALEAKAGRRPTRAWMRWKHCGSRQKSEALADLVNRRGRTHAMPHGFR